jgi:hypothetical protein
MIDTDKYEGHATEGWRRPNGSAYPILKATNNADAELMADAPLLLAEVIRLREGIEQLYESIGTMETQGNIAIRKALKEMIE